MNNSTSFRVSMVVLRIPRADDGPKQVFCAWSCKVFGVVEKFSLYGGEVGGLEGGVAGV